MSNENGFIIETKELVRKFGDTVAVDGLNLAIEKGELFGLVGPDGAGKTTTIRMLVAIMNPTSGSASVLGYDTKKESESIKPYIGYMAQQFSMYNDLSVIENLNFFADVFSVRGQVRRQRIQKLLAFARLTEFTDRRAGHLSGGMKKKLALACALIHEPDILYLDEPTTGVDPVSRREFWDILTELHIQGVTILVSTPYMDEAERCSRVGLMFRGHLIECDTPAAIKSLLPGQLLEFKPVSDSSRSVGMLRQAKAVVEPLSGVLEVQTYGDLLHVFVDQAATRQNAIVAALNQAGIDVRNMRTTKPRMEQAFISLVRREEAQRQREEQGEDES
ncbi:MAG: ABC transporter ATP-binding protein [Chloroflexota bacterium]|nr:ABC transporter ATP-binding protein [Chloroflexota bacterium]